MVIDSVVPESAVRELMKYHMPNPANTNAIMIAVAATIRFMPLVLSWF